MLRDRIRVNILRVRLPLNVVNAAGQRATGRTLTAPYYGWVLVGALGVTETISWGVLYYAFSVFLTPMETDLGWSRAETTGAFSLALVLSGVAAIGAGRWLDRHGARVLMTAGSCMGVRAGAGLGVSQHAARLLPRLGRHRGGHGGGAVRARLCGHHRLVRSKARARADRGDAHRGLFEHHFSAALRLAGGSPGLASGAALARCHPGRRHHPRACAPASASTRRSGLASGWPVRSAESRRLAPGRRASRSRAALRDPTFRWVTLAFCLSTAVAFGAQLHLVPILLERGFSPMLAATIAGLIGATQVLGRVLMIPFTGRVSLRSLSVAVLALQPVALLVLLLVPDLAGVIAFVVLFGAAKGCLTLVRPAFVADLYGPAHYASIAGVLAFSVTHRPGRRAARSWRGL